jgi:hypothetical protein
LAHRRQISIGKDSFVIPLARIVAVGATRLIGKGGIVTLTGDPLILSMRRNGDVVGIRGGGFRAIGEDGAALVDGINITSARSAGGAPKPFAADARIPVRAGRNRLGQADGLGGAILNSK